MRELAVQIYRSALAATDSVSSTEKYIDYISSVYENGRFRRFYMISFGKASHFMAKVIDERLSHILTYGIVITKYGHLCDTYLSRKIEVFEAGHPIPDQKGIVATQRVMELCKSADTESLVLCLISGGGSSLLLSPLEPLSLEEKRQMTELLLKTGCDIFEVNTVRKHLSKVKGGRLAAIAYPARVISLIISDVPGDRVDMIASGPTVPDPTTYADATDVLLKYGLSKTCPGNAQSIIENGVRGMIPETPKEDHPAFRKTDNIIVANNKMALDAARRKAIQMGFQTVVLSYDLNGEAKEAGKWLADMTKKWRGVLPLFDRRGICLLSGGETTVTVRGCGVGGRNMELALSFALEIKDIPGITLLSAGTDGTDGPTDAAGAFADGNTIERALKMGLNAEEFLIRNDTYTFFSKTGDLFVTGPTGTNVMDLQIILIDNQSLSFIS